MRWPLGSLVGPLTLLVLVACDRTDGPGGAGPARVLTTIDEASRPVGYALDSTPYINGRATVEAVSLRGEASFLILSREARMRQHPCSGCHTVPLASMQVGADGRRAHWSIELAHAPEAVMQCVTCHDVDGRTLKLLGGQAVGFDHAYRMCAQCHSQQVSDWTGGAHGKRAGGWAPPRVVYNCTECHDPHRPALASRWPARMGPLQDETRRR